MPVAATPSVTNVATASGHAEPGLLMQQLRGLQSQLALSSAQRPMFDKLSQAMMESATTLAEMRTEQDQAPPNAMIALRNSMQMSQERMDAVGRIGPVLRDFRETLSPGQQQILDRDFTAPAGIGCGLLCRAGIQ